MPIEWISEQIKEVGVDFKLHPFMLIAVQNSQNSESSFVWLHVLWLSKDTPHLNLDTSKSML